MIHSISRCMLKMLLLLLTLPLLLCSCYQSRCYPAVNELLLQPQSVTKFTMSDMGTAAAVTALAATATAATAAVTALAATATAATAAVTALAATATAAVTALAATATAAAAETLQLTSTHVIQVSVPDASHAAELLYLTHSCICELTALHTQKQSAWLASLTQPWLSKNGPKIVYVSAGVGRQYTAGHSCACNCFCCCRLAIYSWAFLYELQGVMWRRTPSVGQFLCMMGCTMW